MSNKSPELTVYYLVELVNERDTLHSFDTGFPKLDPIEKLTKHQVIFDNRVYGEICYVVNESNINKFCSIFLKREPSRVRKILAYNQVSRL